MPKLKQLLGMSRKEISHRVSERYYAETERLGLSSGIISARAPFKDYLAGEPSRRFYAGVKRETAELIRSEFPLWIDRAVEEADRLCRHDMQFLNCERVDLGDEIDWHRDPVSGQLWEGVFWANFNPEHDPAGRDSKKVHELNRHQHLPRLAKAWFLTGEERYAAEAVRQLNSWVEQNPPHQGINWQSSLELALRTVSWLWTIFLLQKSAAFDDETAQRVGDSLFTQLEHIYRHLSTYSSPNTHLLGEAVALFIGGTVFRDDPRAARWLSHSAAVLAREAETQIHADGVYGELSTYYHCYTLDFYLQVLSLAGHNDIAFPDSVRDRVSAMLRFTAHVTRPDGTVPLIGDDDGGRALALQQTSYRSFSDGLCLGAILSCSGQLKYQSGGFHEEASWLLGRDGFETFRKLDACVPEETQLTFAAGGLTSQRSGWGRHDSHLIFDCGGLGAYTGGHSHADALSVSLFGGGRELLVDPGTCIYNGAPEWRAYFRSTRAHNGVTIDGRNQAESGGTFRWNTRWSTKYGFQADLNGLQYVEGQHDAYSAGAAGIIHRRRLLNVSGEYWVIVDDFRGAGEHDFEFSFHLGADVVCDTIQRDPRGFELRDSGGFLLNLHASSDVGTECLTGSLNPVGGWASRGYGEKHPATSIHSTMRATAPAAAMSIVAPEHSGASPRSSAFENGAVIVCRYSHEASEDIIIYSGTDNPFEIDGFRMEGEFFWLRQRGGSPLQVGAVRARSLSYNGQEIFQQAPGPYFSKRTDEDPAITDKTTTDKNLCVQSAAS
jgi:hypothetical protein